MERVALQARALVYVALARVLLARHDTTHALRRLAGATTRRRDRHVDLDASVVAVQRAGRLTRAACLPQSVALVALWARTGNDPVLVLGCRRYEDRRWGAHAWVEVGGKVFEPVPAGAHEELATLDAAHAWLPAARA